MVKCTIKTTKTQLSTTKSVWGIELCTGYKYFPFSFIEIDIPQEEIKFNAGRFKNFSNSVQPYVCIKRFILTGVWDESEKLTKDYFASSVDWIGNNIDTKWNIDIRFYPITDNRMSLYLCFSFENEQSLVLFKLCK